MSLGMLGEALAIIYGPASCLRLTSTCMRVGDLNASANVIDIVTDRLPSPQIIEDVCNRINEDPRGFRDDVSSLVGSVMRSLRPGNSSLSLNDVDVSNMQTLMYVSADIMIGGSGIEKLGSTLEGLDIESLLRKFSITEEEVSIFRYSLKYDGDVMRKVYNFYSGEGLERVVGVSSCEIVQDIIDSGSHSFLELLSKLSPNSFHFCYSLSDYNGKNSMSLHELLGRVRSLAKGFDIVINVSSAVISGSAYGVQHAVRGVIRSSTFESNKSIIKVIDFTAMPRNVIKFIKLEDNFKEDWTSKIRCIEIEDIDDYLVV